MTVFSWLENTVNRQYFHIVECYTRFCDEYSPKSTCTTLKAQTLLRSNEILAKIKIHLKCQIYEINGKKCNIKKKRLQLPDWGSFVDYEEPSRDWGKHFETHCPKAFTSQFKSSILCSEKWNSNNLKTCELIRDLY